MFSLSLSHTHTHTHTHTHSMWVTLYTAISSLVGMGGERFGSQRLPDVYWEQECCLPFLPGVLLEWRLEFALVIFSFTTFNKCSSSAAFEIKDVGFKMPSSTPWFGWASAFCPFEVLWMEKSTHPINTAVSITPDSPFGLFVCLWVSFVLC